MSSNINTPQERTKEFARNIELEDLLKDINSSLWLSERETLNNCGELKFPLVIVVGPHRSGTTLFMQWLANTGLFSYPTNLLSRFYQAPIIGAKIQLLLTDPRYNFRDELGEFTQRTEYSSVNGKTKGVLAPNEFWYFWRRFLSDPGRDVWSDSELLASMDTKTMVAELAGIMDVFQKPFAAKGMLFNYNIPFLDSIFDKVLFVYVKRDLASNVASVLEARKRQLGSEDEWYSFKIPEYEKLKNLEPHSQVIGQLQCINDAVSRGMESVSEKRKMVLNYEEFCEDPARIFKKITTMLGIDVGEYSGPRNFTVTARKSIEDKVK